MEPWTQWQHDVVALLKDDFDQTLGHISIDDVDWSSWRHLYEQGRSARSAIERALERDI